MKKFARLQSILNKLKACIIVAICQLLPFTKDCVLFQSYQGMYNDNPRAISEKLHAVDESIPIYWTISKQGNEELPSYVHSVKIKSIKYWAYTVLAKVAVDSGVGIRRIHYKKKSPIALFARAVFCKKKEGQLNISTWHGTPIKSIIKNFADFWQEGTREESELFSSSDYLIAGCQYTKTALVYATDNMIPVKLYGTPRNDIFFDRNVDVNEIKRKLHLPINKKIVLFAPTWRPYSLELSGKKQLESFAISELLHALNSTFGGDFTFVFRVHPVVLREMKVSGLLSMLSSDIVDGNIGDDMREYLLCTDILITDYSGSMFDFALTKRPCFLFTPDREQYAQRPGFYKDFDWLPFPKASSYRELIDVISAFNKKTYQEGLNCFLREMGNVEDGHAADRVVSDICQFCRDSKNTLQNRLGE